MSESSGARTLRSHCRELEQKGSRVFAAACEAPLLVCVHRQDTSPSDLTHPTLGLAKQSFDTEFLDDPDATAASHQSYFLGNVQIGPESRVHPVAKRTGGAFSSMIGVGRTNNIDIRVPLTGLSKYHAYFVLKRDQWHVGDARSRNGTWVNEVPVPARSPQPIKDGALIGFGPVRFLFLMPPTFIDVLIRTQHLSEPAVVSTLLGSLLTP